MQPRRNRGVRCIRFVRLVLHLPTVKRIRKMVRQNLLKLSGCIGKINAPPFLHDDAQSENFALSDVAPATNSIKADPSDDVLASRTNQLPPIDSVPITVEFLRHLGRCAHFTPNEKGE